MVVIKTNIDGVLIIEPTVFGDNRGYFMETYNQKDMEEAFRKLMTNENIKRYVDANNAFKTLIDQVNAIIAFYVKGEEQQGGCSGNCSSCGGCN